VRHTPIGLDLELLQQHLHEAFDQEDRAITKKVQRLEKELTEIIAKAEDYTDQLEELMQFSAILNSTLDTHRVRELAMKATCKVLRCEGATLYLIDEEKHELCFETIVGAISAEQMKEIRLPLNDQSVAGIVALSREGVIINDIEKEQRHNKRFDRQNKFLTRNMLCVPLESKGKVMGVLQAINKTRGNWDTKEKRLLDTLAHQVAIAVENSLLYQKLKNQFYETVFAMANAVDAKDRYTGGHTKRVAYFSEMIAKYMGLSRDQVEEVRLTAILHDIGKIGIDDKVLKKEAPLDKSEWEHMKLHPELGYKILAGIPSMKKISEGMRFHHERPDGHGYPQGLKGEEIPLIARIISVADTFDAMTSNRPYRKGMEYEVAFAEIVQQRGKQFDEKVVDAFVKAFTLERMGKKRGSLGDA
jgi:HD-GYP domain-containing protein (c-di-GMP phosphodiesterase class II)